MQTNGGFFELSDQRLEYAWFGAERRDQAPALVLLHEGLGSVALWRDFPGKLAERTGRAVMAYSRAGYGKSSPCALPRPVNFMHAEGLEVLPRVLEAAGITDAILVGHSDGGSIALIHAGGTDALRVRAVVTLAAHVFNEDLCVASIEAARRAFAETDLRDKLARYHGDNVDCAFRGWNDVWLDPAFRRWNIEEFLPGIKVPLLAMQGADDQYGTPAQIEAIACGTGGRAETLMIPDCRHSAHLEQPGVVLDAIAEFIAAKGQI